MGNMSVFTPFSHRFEGTSVYDRTKPKVSKGHLDEIAHSSRDSNRSLLFVPLIFLFAALGFRFDLIFILLPFSLVAAGISFLLVRLFKKPFFLHVPALLLVGIAVALFLVALIIPDVGGNGWGDLVLVAMAFVLAVVGSWTRAILLIVQTVQSRRHN
ncbi:MAG: hypothetical protein MZU97_21270 [Bacillus subtilis]|nr:hypothetical protein [Bacillus subtilis]